MHIMFTLIVRHCFLTILLCFLQQASVYLQEMNKLKTELESAQNEVSTLKESFLNAPKSSHLDQVVSIFLVNFTSLHWLPFSYTMESQGEKAVLVYLKNDVTSITKIHILTSPISICLS